MTTTSPTLAEFLLARIAERQRSIEVATERGLAFTAIQPGEMLAECDAFRAIIAEHEMTEIRREPDRGKVLGYWWDAYCRRCTMDGEYTDITKNPSERPCDTLLALAAVYADHPDYRAEWADDLH